MQQYCKRWRTYAIGHHHHNAEPVLPLVLTIVMMMSYCVGSSSLAILLHGWALGFHLDTNNILCLHWVHLEQQSWWNFTQNLGGGRFCLGHSKSDPAYQLPVNIPSGIYDPVGCAISAKVIAHRYIQTWFAMLSSLLVTPVAFANASSIATSPFHCRDGVHAFSIHDCAPMSCIRFLMPISNPWLMYSNGNVISSMMGFDQPCRQLYIIQCYQYVVGQRLIPL